MAETRGIPTRRQGKPMAGKKRFVAALERRSVPNPHDSDRLRPEDRQAPSARDLLLRTRAGARDGGGDGTLAAESEVHEAGGIHPEAAGKEAEALQLPPQAPT